MPKQRFPIQDLSMSDLITGQAVFSSEVPQLSQDG